MVEQIRRLDYEAMERAKGPAQMADQVGEYIYYTEFQRAPVGCDFAAQLSFYGDHYFLYPQRADLPRLKGRGIVYDETCGGYTVTKRAYQEIKKKYRVQRALYLD